MGAAFIHSHEDAVLLVDNEHYQVASGQLDGTEYDVHCDVRCCSCYSGQQGGFCKHQAAVHIKFGKSFPNSPLLSANDKIGLYTIATGNHSEMPPSFFAPMSDIDTERENIEVRNPEDVEAETPLTGDSSHRTDSSCSNAFR